ncbi:MAG: hypothetical protein M1546_17300 [Chloroflexi bacterium]|nr:hypothetical protein [Chloroflexota bacterium]
MSCILLLALAVRVYLLIGPLNPIESDEAVVGLIAQRILHGERPFFEAGFLQHGFLEAYLTAPLFAAFGMNRLTLRLVPLGFSLLFILAVYWLGQALYGRRAGLLSALYVAVPPSMLTIWGLKAGAGYIDVLTLGTLSLALTIHSMRHKANATRWAAIWVLILIGVWVHLIAGFYALVIGLAMAYWVIRRLQQRYGAVVIAVLTSALLAPTLILATVFGSQLTTALPGLAFVESATEFRLNLVSTIKTAMPIMAGVLQPSASESLFSQQLAGRQGIIQACVWICVTLCAVVLWANRRVLTRASGMLCVLVLITATAFCLFRLNFIVHEPRYLLPLYTAIPLAAYALVESWDKSSRVGGTAQARPWLTTGVTAAILILNLYSNVAIKPALNLPSLSGYTLADNQALVEWFDRRDIHHVYTDYWIGYWLAFESQGRVVPYIIGPNNTIGWNRHIPYAVAVEESTDPAYVFLADSPEEQAFAQHLGAHGITHRLDHVLIYTIYWELSAHVHFPVDNR